MGLMMARDFMRISWDRLQILPLGITSARRKPERIGQRFARTAGGSHLRFSQVFGLTSPSKA